jgi:cytochrome c oxidase assembly protein subunit 15
MHALAAVVGRVRAYEVAPALFRKVALASVVLLYLVVTTGALVRLTGSGLGCENWPRCGDAPFPTSEVGAHQIIEFGNRVVAFFAVLATLATWLAARKTRGLPRWVVWVALAAFLGTFAQIPLGGLTVMSGLHPLVVMQHFLLALVVVGLGVLVLSEARGHEAGLAPPLVPGWLRRLGLVLVVACGALVITGAFATAAGPHPGDSSDVSRVLTVEGTVYVHVRAAAVFGIAFLVTLGVLVWRRTSPRLLAGALGLLALLVTQMALGEVQYREGLPWWLVLVHVTLAAGIWASTVALVVAFWRPLAALAPGSPGL